MKVCHYSPTHYLDINRLAIIDGDQLIDVNRCWLIHFQQKGYFNARNRADHHLPPSLYQLLNLQERPIEKLQETFDLYLKLKKSGDLNSNEGLPVVAQDYFLQRPLDKISVYRDFYTHEKHVQKGFEKRGEKIPDAWYEMPVYYKGPSHGFIGPSEEILWPHYSNQLDFELELAAITSRDGKNISEKEADHYIFGLTILNDVSARDIQRKEMSVRLGPSKGKDFCSVIGPVITTYDEFNYQTPRLKMTAKINGELWSEGYSDEGHFNFAQMLSFASQSEWITSGDILGSGTVGSGCGLELDRWIKEGDIIELEVEKIGILKNKVGKKEIKK